MQFVNRVYISHQQRSTTRWRLKDFVHELFNDPWVSSHQSLKSFVMMGGNLCFIQSPTGTGKSQFLADLTQTHWGVQTPVLYVSSTVTSSYAAADSLPEDFQHYLQIDPPFSSKKNKKLIIGLRSLHKIQDGLYENKHCAWSLVVLDEITTLMNLILLNQQTNKNSSAAANTNLDLATVLTRLVRNADKVLVMDQCMGAAQLAVVMQCYKRPPSFIKYAYNLHQPKRFTLFIIPESGGLSRKNYLSFVRRHNLKGAGAVSKFLQCLHTHTQQETRQTWLSLLRQRVTNENSQLPVAVAVSSKEDGKLLKTLLCKFWKVKDVLFICANGSNTEWDLFHSVTKYRVIIYTAALSVGASIPAASSLFVLAKVHHSMPSALDLAQMIGRVRQTAVVFFTVTNKFNTKVSGGKNAEVLKKQMINFPPDVVSHPLKTPSLRDSAVGFMNLCKHASDAWKDINNDPRLFYETLMMILDPHAANIWVEVTSRQKYSDKPTVYFNENEPVFPKTSHNEEENQAVSKAIDRIFFKPKLLVARRDEDKRQIASVVLLTIAGWFYLYRSTKNMNNADFFVVKPGFKLLKYLKALDHIVQIFLDIFGEGPELNQPGNRHVFVILYKNRLNREHIKLLNSWLKALPLKPTEGGGGCSSPSRGEKDFFPFFRDVFRLIGVTLTRRTINFKSRFLNKFQNTVPRPAEVVGCGYSIYDLALMLNPLPE